MQASLDRRNGRLERPRCFSRGVLLKIVKYQDLPVLCGKANNGSADRLRHFNAIDKLKRGFAGRGECIEITNRLAGRPAPLSATSL
jgi:hypothetical protein